MSGMGTVRSSELGADIVELSGIVGIWPVRVTLRPMTIDERRISPPKIPPIHHRIRVNLGFSVGCFIPFAQNTTLSLFTHRRRDGLQQKQKTVFSTLAMKFLHKKQENQDRGIEANASSGMTTISRNFKAMLAD
jgi:hypothetical protein